MSMKIRDAKINKRMLTGQNGEEMARRYLELSGYKILSRNYRCRIGEIDIIAEKDGVLTFIEVKTRHTTVTGYPSESVTFTKQQKIRNAAQYYMLERNMLENMPVLSFDVIEIVQDEDRIMLFNHYPHCF